jgi:DNA repair protein RAD50
MINRTTIIESLKYAVTGSLPPGKNAGQSFVHDPKSLGQSGVKASIKLRFTNAASNVMVVVRSMELTQKKAKLTFSALDGVLRTTNKEGKRVNMSHKCTELDRQIPLLLGVSKPILEHVVFCHQEESSWPLMDSAVLKKRFDDIFDSTRYTKALKNIEEIKKEYKDTVKDLKAEVAGLASHKHAAKGFRQELESQNEELEKLEEKIEECRLQIKDADKLIEKNKEIIGKVEELQSDLDEKQNEFEREEAVLESKIKYLDEDLTERHSARDLRDMLRDFDNLAVKRNEAREDLERLRQKYQDEICAFGQESNTLMIERGRFVAEKQRLEELSKDRLKKMDEISNKWGIELPITQSQNSSFLSQGKSPDDSWESTQDAMLNISDGDMKAFLSALREKEERLKEELSEHRLRSQTEGDQIQDAYSDLSARQRALESGKEFNCLHFSLKFYTKLTVVVEKDKVSNQVRDAQKEILSLKSQGTLGRMRQTDVSTILLQK